jgi:cation/acetate symporter
VNYETSGLAVTVFAVFVAAVLGLSFWLGAKTRSLKGYYAAHGQIPWFINGIAFAGDYLSAASFLGICGMIAVYGFDGFLYSIGFLAGWIVALFVVAEPLKRLGRFTFADALDRNFDSRGIKISAALSTLVVSIVYLIPQMVGAGALVKPLLGMSHQVGVMLVGVIVIVIVATAGMVSTTWVQFIKGSMLVVFCAVLTAMILVRGLSVGGSGGLEQIPSMTLLDLQTAAGSRVMSSAAWMGKPYLRVQEDDGGIATWRISDDRCSRAQTLTVGSREGTLVDGKPVGVGPGHAQLKSVGAIESLPGGVERTGPLSPAAFLSALQDSVIVQWPSEKIPEADGSVTTVYYPKRVAGASLMQPGGYFKGIQGELPELTETQQSRDEFKKALFSRLDFISLMLALFCGTASLPHILIRYYTVKDQASARKSTVVGIASIGFFYVLTLFLGLAAMTTGTLDPTNSNMAAPLLAKSFGPLPFAIVSAIAFTTILGTVSGLILAASGAIAHDLMTNVLKLKMNDHQKVHAGKISAVVIGAIAMWLGIQCESMNVGFLVGWAFAIAASANLPALIMLLFWKGTTKQGITAAVVVGMLTSLGWILLSADAYKVYGIDTSRAITPFSQPGLVTIPLGFIVLVVASLMTRRGKAA